MAGLATRAGTFSVSVPLFHPLYPLIRSYCTEVTSRDTNSDDCGGHAVLLPCCHARRDAGSCRCTTMWPGHAAANVFAASTDLSPPYCDGPVRVCVELELLCKQQPHLCPHASTRRRSWPLFVLRRAERSSDSNFLAGFVVGGVVFGALGFLLAPQISKTLLSDDARLRLPRFLEDEAPKDPEATKQDLIDKIAQLNASIDEVASQLKSKDAEPAPLS